jgi:large subunit ribosomal protein L15
MRGGSGRTGRYRHKKSLLIRNKEFVNKHYAGKKGFKSVPQIKKQIVQALNLGQLAGMLDKLVSEKKAQLEGQKVVLDLKSIGFGKLLGGGSISRPLRVTVDHCSASAIEKIKEAGGETILPKPTPTETK